MLRRINTKSYSDCIFSYEILKQRYSGEYPVSLIDDEPPTYEEHVNWINNLMELNDNAFCYNFYLIYSRATDIGILTFDASNNEIGIFVHKNHQGQGIGEKMFYEFRDKYLCRDYGNYNSKGQMVIKVVARIHEENITSQKFFEKVGFKKLGYIYEYSKWWI